MRGKKPTISAADLTSAVLEKELFRVEKSIRFRRTLSSTISFLMIVVAVAVTVSVTVCPVLRVFGSSMEPTLSEGDILVSVKTGKVSVGELVAFYYENKVLVKRCIAVSGDWIWIEENGEVSVNEKKLSEPYLTKTALGECDIEMPYLVPEGRFFVMGDDRENSIDSRSEQLGCVSSEQIIGKILIRIWPVNKIRFFKQ